MSFGIMSKMVLPALLVLLVAGPAAAQFGTAQAQAQALATTFVPTTGDFGEHLGLAATVSCVWSYVACVAILLLFASVTHLSCVCLPSV
jgi:hypothetical protein